MGFKVLIVLCASVCLANAAVISEEPVVGTKDGVQVDWYDCSERGEGNYQHPHECTKYIACTRANLAYEMPCAVCHEHPVTCPEGILHFNEAQNKCLYADEAGCSAGGKPTTTRRTTTTTEAPTTPDQDTGPTRPTPGTWCDPDECKLDGWCDWYDWCERDEDTTSGKIKGKNGTWATGYCSTEHNMYFNKKKTEHGGICDFWENLDPEVQAEYNNNPACIDPHCEWEVDPDAPWCASTYIYFHPDRYGGKKTKLTCPTSAAGPSLWSQADKNCLHCSKVNGEDGNPCPCPGD